MWAGDEDEDEENEDGFVIRRNRIESRHQWRGRTSCAAGLVSVISASA
jgi:hypothetical protein